LFGAGGSHPAEPKARFVASRAAVVVNADHQAAQPPISVRIVDEVGSGQYFVAADERSGSKALLPSGKVTIS